MDNNYSLTDLATVTNAADGVVTMWDEYHNVIRHDEIVIPVAPTAPAADAKTE